MSLQQIEPLFYEYLASDPDVSTALGMENKLDELGDPSLDEHYRSLESAKTLAQQIRVDSEQNFYNKLDLHLIRLKLQQDIFFRELQFNGKLQRVQKPGGIDGISEGIFQLFINDPRDPKSRLDNILSRLKKAEDYLNAELNVLDTPVERWRDIEIMQGEGLPDLFSTILNWAKETQYDCTEVLASEIDRVNSALKNYLDALKEMPTTKVFAIGEKKAKELLALREINRSPEELRAMAEKYMRDTDEIVDELRKKLVGKYSLAADIDAAQLQEYLNKKYAVSLEDGKLDSILDAYHQEKSKLLEFLQQKKLFPVPDEQDMHIIKTPGFLEPVIPAGAMWPPIALRKGIKKSLVYLTLKHDVIDEHTHLGIPTMMLHEGIPGHHLQFTSASIQPSLVRKIFNALEHAEGWTTMLEDYMLDLGYVGGELIDEVRFIAKREISRLAARVGIDLYFMTGNRHYLNVGLDLEFDSDDPFENAGKLLKTATGFTDGRVQAELNWYSIERGYPLCYLTGNRMVWQLKQEITEANPKQLNSDELDREFHRVYLETGCMPVNSLREVYKHEGLL